MALTVCKQSYLLRRYDFEIIYFTAYFLRHFFICFFGERFDPALERDLDLDLERALTLLDLERDLERDLDLETIEGGECGHKTVFVEFINFTRSDFFR